MTTVRGDTIRGAFRRAAVALKQEEDRLTQLDQALGDGDLGITAAKMAEVLERHAAEEVEDDVGQYLLAAGMAINRAAPSTFGTLAATALLRAAKEVRGLAELGPHDLAAMLSAADAGVQERGKAKPGDKTVVDALHPAAQAFEREVEKGTELAPAAAVMLDAAQRGMDSVTERRSRTGRAGWIGERTQGKVDPGCHLLIIVLRAVLEGRGPLPGAAT